MAEAGRDDPDASASSSRSRSSGWRLGRYQVREGLGAGSMGLVVRAHDPQLDRDVALKVLRLGKGEKSDGGASEAGRPISRARFIHEARTLAQLSHENIVEIYDVDTAGEMTFIAMELVEGDTLEAWLAKPRTWQQVVDVFLEAGRGLAAAHDAGFVHRDFKPANVLVGVDGRVRVMDFGLATSVREAVAVTVDERSLGLDQSHTFDCASLTQTGMTVGTPIYMSPEQHVGRPADGRSDQFSFCVALYEGLYGVRPYRARGSHKLAKAKQLGRIRTPPPERRVPSRIDDIIRRGLSPKAKDRFESMHELLGELRRAMRPRRASARMIGWTGAAAAIIAAWIGASPSMARLADETDVREETVALIPGGAWRQGIVRGRIALRGERLGEAERQFAEAYFASLDAGDHESAAEAAAQVAIVLAVDPERRSEQRIWEGHAQAERERSARTLGY